MSTELLRFNTDAKVLLLDFETFNLNLNFFKNRTWQATLIRVKGDNAQETRDLLTDWSDCDLKIGDDAARITGFRTRKVQRYGWKTMEDVLIDQGITPQETFDQMYEWIEQCDYLIGHNVLGFDLPLLIQWYMWAGKEWEHLHEKVIDTFPLSKGYKLGIPYNPGEDFMSYQYRMLERRAGRGYSLSAMGKHFDITHDYENTHDALVDLELNLKLWNKLKWQVEI